MDEDEVQSHFLEIKEEFKNVPVSSFTHLIANDDLKINTKRTIYTIRFLDAPPKPKRLATMVSTGKHSFNGRVMLVGSVLKSFPDGQLLIMEGCLMVGVPVVFFDIAEDRLLQLPATQEVWLNGKRILPDFSKIPTREQ